MILLNSLFPVFALLLLGNLLKRFNLTTEEFLKTSDRLIYFIFFPVMLFWKIGGASLQVEGLSGLYISVIITVMVAFLLSTLTIKAFKLPDFQAGSYSQSCIRFNTYVGVAVVLNTLGDQGIQVFGILIGIIIPIINVLVIIILIWHSGFDYSPKRKLINVSKELIKNPLVLGCLAGIIYSKVLGSFPTFLDNTFSLMSMITLPLALLSIGAVLTFQSLRIHFKVSMLAALFKLLLMPVLGYFLLKRFNVVGLPFKTAMLFFALPTSTALYVLSAQLNSDTELASASIVLSTVLSFISLSVVLLLF